MESFFFSFWLRLCRAVQQDCNYQLSFKVPLRPHTIAVEALNEPAQAR
jgi:hypothetical protein